MKPLSVKIIIIICVLYIAALIVPEVIQYTRNPNSLSFKGFFVISIFFLAHPVFILIGIWRRSAESVRFISLLGLLFGLITLSGTIIFFSIILTIVSFLKSVQEYCNPGMFEEY